MKVGSGIEGAGSGIGSAYSRGVKSSSNRSSGGRVWANSSRDGSYDWLSSMAFSYCEAGSSGTATGTGSGDRSAGVRVAHLEVSMAVIIMFVSGDKNVVQLIWIWVFIQKYWQWCCVVVLED